MIRLIYGKKGSGKSKLLLSMANSEAATAKGNIVYIDDNTRCIYDLKHQIRFINITEYDINSADSLYGFICGIIAGDFDIHSLYIDGLKKIIYREDTDIENILSRLDRVLKDKQAIIAYSCEDDVPEELKKYTETK